jgi:putative cardiolipin synthase
MAPPLPVAAAARDAQTELLMVTPYFVPTEAESKLLTDLRARGVRVRILTNSMESAPESSAHSGYVRARLPLLKAGVEFHEVRSLLGSARGSGQTGKISRFGNFALHAKLYVFDRRQVVIGSMNFDQRSNRLNTEDGLLIDSPVIAEQAAARFEAMTSLDNAYSVSLRADPARKSARLIWRSIENGKTVEYDREPARSAWQKFKVALLSLFPLDREL